jgi:hypothetical protein
MDSHGDSDVRGASAKMLPPNLRGTVDNGKSG